MKKILFLIVFFLLIINVVGTLSIFESNIEAPVESTLAGWKIRVNDNLIGQDTEFEINDIIWENNSHVKDGKTAPGTIGYFDLEIVPEDVNVSFSYTFSIDDESYEDTNFKLLSVDTDASEIVKIDDSTYSGVYFLDDIEAGKSTIVRFNLMWENNEEDSLLDSSYIGVDKTINIPITMSFSQYVD